MRDRAWRINKWRIPVSLSSPSSVDKLVKNLMAEAENASIGASVEHLASFLGIGSQKGMTPDVVTQGAAGRMVQDS